MVKPAHRDGGNGWIYVKERQGVMTDQQTAEVQEKHAHTIADYVGDMVALESHIEEALDRQLTETQDDPEAQTAV
jgi:hypothetical protein